MPAARLRRVLGAQTRSPHRAHPRTGAAVKVAVKRVPFFKPGKELRLKVNGGVEP